MKKFLASLLTLAVAVLLGFGTVGCSKTDKDKPVVKDTMIKDTVIKDSPVIVKDAPVVAKDTPVKDAKPK